MKYHLSIIICLLLLPLFSIGQFAAPQYISPVSRDVKYAKSGDYDGDGDLDVLVSSYRGGNLVWYENDGLGNFYHYHIVIDSEEAWRAITAGDFNLDGATDIVIGRHSNGDNATQLLMNNGDGIFSSTILVVPTGFNKIESIETIDMDNDGLLDVAMTDSETGRACWFRNLGTGQFSAANQIYVAPDLEAKYFGDLNRDGFPDVFLFHDDGILCCLLNDSTGYSYYLDTLYTDPDLGFRTFGSGDFDADGDVDMAVEISTSATYDKIVWLENDGQGNFYNTTMLIPPSYAISGAACTVINFDNLPGDEFIINKGGLLVFYMSGNGSFTQDTISSLYGSARGLEYEDFNNDEIHDFLFSGTPMILLGNGALNNWTEVSHMNTPGDCRDIDMADVDKDGDLDLIAVSHNGWSKVEYMLYEDGAYSESSGLIDYSMQSRFNLFTKDYDGDGAIDIEYTGWYNGRLTWARNNGFGLFEEPQILIDEDHDCWSSGLEDFDNDDDLDIIMVPDGIGADEIMLYRNTGNVFTPENILPNDYGSTPGRMITFDLENDGDKDAAFAAHEDIGGLVVLINDGTGQFNTIFLDDITDFYRTHISACDFDQDGDNDLLFNYAAGSALVVVYEYSNGEFIRHLIDAPDTYTEYFPSITGAADIDNDGLSDIVCIAGHGNNFQPPDGIHWYRNLGNFEFSNPYFSLINIEFYQPFDMEVFDRDLDGDDDIIVSDQGNIGGIIFYLENLFWGSFWLQGNVFFDLNNNSILDTSDLPFPFIDIQVNPTESAFFTNDEGEYNVLTGIGTYTIIPSLDTVLWTFSTNSSYTLALDSATPMMPGLDFGVIPNGVHPNGILQVVEPNSPCNTSGGIWITLRNLGNTILSGNIAVTVDPLLTLLSSSPAADSIVGNTVYLSLDSLFYYNMTTWIININMPSEQNIGQSMSISATYNDVSGLMLSDNAWQVLTCAYDPNDKIESTGIGEEEYISNGQWLEYTIRFQNTGNDTATNVTIRDPLSLYLDRSTLTPISWSFSPEISVEPDGDAVFKFKDIMLPDSGANFPGSQGFIRYRIKADTNLYPGTIINNTAHIIFDFNPPITTNTTVNTVECYTPTGQVIAWNYPKLFSPFTHPVSQQWYLNDEPIDGATGTSLIPAANGIYRVDAIYPIDCKVSSIPYTFNSIDIYETEIIMAVVYPNPFKNVTTVEFNYPLNGNNTLIITDLTGREVVRKSGINGNRLTVSASETGKGFFLLYIEFDGKRSFIGKLVAE